MLKGIGSGALTRRMIAGKSLVRRIVGQLLIQRIAGSADALNRTWILFNTILGVRRMHETLKLHPEVVG